jgi:acyl-CoA reductase-like NAD-dependent aldehyde dehydrogenase
VIKPGEQAPLTVLRLVHEPIHDDFLARFARAAEALVVGDGLDPATDIGAMVDAAQRDKVLGYLRTGLDEGALETLHEFVRSKNIRFPSGRGAVPVWPPRDS